jgi:hypothetical protein
MPDANPTDIHLQAAKRIVSDTKAAIASKDILVISRLASLYKTLKGDNVIGTIKTESTTGAINLIESIKKIKDGIETMNDSIIIFNKWRNELNVNDIIDVYERKFKSWYTAKILRRDNNIINIDYFGFSGNKGLATIDDINDENYGVSPAFSCVMKAKLGNGGKIGVGRINPKNMIDVWNYEKRLIPSYLHDEWEQANPCPSVDNDKEPPRYGQQGYRPEVTEMEVEIASEDESPSDAIVNTNRRSRASSPRNNNNNTITNSNNKKDSREEHVPDEGEDDNDWVCGICEVLEDIDGTPLVLCDGPCMRSFHTSCLGLTGGADTLPTIGDVWLCDDCAVGKHKCFICKEHGKDYLEVALCSANKCGKYYHERCLLQLDQPQVANSSSSSSSNIDSESSFSDHKNDMFYLKTDVKHIKKTLPPVVKGKVQNSLHGNNITDRVVKWDIEKSKGAIQSQTQTQIHPDYTKEMIEEARNVMQIEQRKAAIVDSFSFKCPLHSCRMCRDFYYDIKTGKKINLPGNPTSGGNKENSEVFPCICCPIAYHSNCIPPGTRYNSVCLLCNLHPEKSLPSKEVRSYKDEGGAIWDQMMIPEEIPLKDKDDDHHFKLPLHYKDIVNETNTPPSYVTINKLGYEGLPKKGKELETQNTDTSKCSCKYVCDDDCINRVLKYECCAHKGSQGGGSGNRGESNNDTDGNEFEKRSNCNLGPKCGNRVFQNRQWSKIVRFREHAMGWGCKAGEDIPEGQLVIEYVGEVIDDAEVELRMKNQKEFTPHDHEYYIMQLENGYFVDGKHKGNDSRFINHSCDPNCELERWVVNGKMRIGIFSTKYITKGEPLSYDYQFDTNEVSSFKCYCGTEKCRGTMAPKKKSNRTASELSLSQRRALIRQGQAREEYENSTYIQQINEISRSCTASHLPGYSIRLIREGPQTSSLDFGGQHGAFLIRNILPQCNAPNYWATRRSHMWQQAEAEKRKVKSSKNGKRSASGGGVSASHDQQGTGTGTGSRSKKVRR